MSDQFKSAGLSPFGQAAVKSTAATAKPSDQGDEHHPYGEHADFLGVGGPSFTLPEVEHAEV